MWFQTAVIHKNVYKEITVAMIVIVTVTEIQMTGGIVKEIMIAAAEQMQERMHALNPDPLFLSRTIPADVKNQEVITIATVINA